MPKQHPYTNRLIHEKSPYLLQHAHNPVDWYPWGQEAFNAATELDRPIFLSIGYSTCHWCHVMEKESFENADVAQLLNESFVCVKVDREELPEIDNLYMEFAQSMMVGAAGWPLNVILTPELQPFFAATYLPAESRQGMMGLVDVVKKIKGLWDSSERERVLQQADGIVDVFEQNIHTAGEEIPSKDILEDSAELLYKMADPVYGGIKGAPKFPIGFQQNLMMRYSVLKNDSRAMFLVNRTLDKMYQGGIYDHLGGGFSRYSVDEQWLVPHFEKMLYDNALLISSYLEAWQANANPLYRRIVEEIIGYILRDMTHPEGGFYSAEDADSEGHEGLFYTWTYDEVMRVIGKQIDAELFCEFFGITPEGNFEGRNILHMPLSLEEFCVKKMIRIENFSPAVEDYKKALFQIREKRVHPFKDDKILSAWNGLMIAAIAEAGAAFDEMRYIEAAERAARFVKTNLYLDGQLLRRWREGHAQYNGGLEDYSHLIRASLALFQAGRGSNWLDWAIELTNKVETDFKAPQGAYYMTGSDEPHLIIRKCQYSDGSEPSGNAVHAANLLKLYQITMNQKYLSSAEDIFRAANTYLEQYPPGYCYQLMNLLQYYDRNAPTIVIALNNKEEHKNTLRHLISKKFLPHKAVIWRNDGDELLFEHIPFVKEQAPIDGKTTVYICKQGTCQKPIHDYDEMVLALENL